MSQVRDILVAYVGLVVLLTFHELGHAWTAWKCGDDTAKTQGRVSLNPLVHMDLIGTVVLPLLMLTLASSGSALGMFLIGWAKPVPVNPANLRHERLDSILIAMAGPLMNVILAVVLLGLCRVSLNAGWGDPVPIFKQFALISLGLCFFNLIPIPPLDGSHVIRVLTRMSDRVFVSIAKVSVILLVVLLQVPVLRQALNNVTRSAYRTFAGWFGLF